MWPDTAPAIRVFIAMSTQWRASAVGFTGLDYAALPAVLQLCRVPRSERPDLFDDLRLMEAEALAVMTEKAR